jgi:vacuolar-type H+-ATPase subunit H
LVTDKGKIAPFSQALTRARSNLVDALASGKSTALEISILRIVVEIMETELKSSPEKLVHLNNIASSRETGASLWYSGALKQAELRLMPELRDPKRYRELKDDYDKFEKMLKDNVRNKARVEVGNYKITRIKFNQTTVKIVDKTAFALDEAFDYHKHDPDFLQTPAVTAYQRLLMVERPDLFEAFRAACELPADIQEINLPRPKRPPYEEAVEFVVSFIPIVGSLVAAYEIASGENLFGRELTDVERGILAAGVLLPWAARTVKAGKSLYTAERMAALYGEDAFQHSYALAMGERLSDDVVGWAKLRDAQKAIAKGDKITREATSELSDTLKSILKDARNAKPKALDPVFESAFKELMAKNLKFAELDALAIERIAAKGVNASHVKGQLLEEMLESKVMGWLREGTSKKALGLEHIKEEIQFIPGHLVRDLRGRQITDGILVTQVGDKLQIVAVFECKAGKSASRELSRAAMSRGELSKDAEKELHAYAKDILEEIQEQARLEGRTITDTVESIMKEVQLTELGGQVRRDIERLADSSIMIGSTKIPVKVSPKTTKFFGIIPNDIKADTITKQLVDNGITNFEVLGMNMSAGELKRASKKLADSLKLQLVEP